MYRSRSRRSRSSSHTFLVFMLVASFGILFAGCSGPEEVGDTKTLVFTDDDMAKYREIADSATGSELTKSASGAEILDTIATGTGSAAVGKLDLSVVNDYKALRQSVVSENTFQVTNDFLNVRVTPSTGAATIERLVLGAPVTVIEFVNGQWAKVKLQSGKEGFAAHRYLAKATSEERLADEKKKYENMYYVSFGFVNIRKSPDQASDKVGEIPGGSIVRPLQIQGGWAKVSFEGKEGYISESYLAKFLPNFIVRQDTYILPVLQYRLTADRTDELLQGLEKHIAALREQGYTFMTFSGLRDLLLAQEQRDVRLDPKQIIVTISGITPSNLKAVSSALNIANINATLFIDTQNVGLSGITEKMLLTMMANGFDIQSGTHTGDDLRALTNAQAELELQQSRKILENYTHKTVFAVSYPQGGTNDRIAQIAADAGYLFGIGDDADRSFSRSQLLRVPAMTVFPSMSIEEVVKFVTGS